MGFKIKNSLTGEFEKLPILTLKGEKRETGGVEEYNKVDYMGNKYETLKQANDANVEYAVKTAIGEFNYLDYDGQHITATDTIEGRSKSAILSGNTLKKDAFVKWATAYGNNVVCPIYHDGSINRSYKVYANRRYTVIRRGIWENVDYSFYNDTNEYIQGNIKSETFIPNVDGYIQIFVDGGEELRTEDNYKNFIVIEGEADKSIPYFEGMQSVKMPVLTTTGKNLVNPNTLITGTIENPS